jgi:hypothetical protein
MMPGDPNPFEVLRLDPATPTEEIVRAAALLRQRAPDEQTIATIRQAVQALTSSAAERQLCELLTHAKPCYDWPELVEFGRAHRRAPAGTPPPVDTEQLLQALLFEQAL